ncbi:uracil phosphoribosyltransferase [Aerococcaceae bacterium zg-ZUI334]|uniref:uracil phosphoribosyltransferase n=1 Tax=Aerococcaceae TaxID=186827 RepID=UPI0013B7B687|nr:MULTISPECIES: uracil phosphoribosyltransferase [unclassified Facklamia]MBR7927441.1 uracil phosphoribosyltransferase [Aerococcaceae bacterium zg-ZUI334]MBS4461268.1 uracil phosphoribosyltransferase [Aerococcaceae bacterium zg-B36]QQD65952.1 uracil phosphoribosyltransferase [Aerococcaceae bacterium zg-252]NEW65150.1 uracil phosphoribosyltransferase [Facklamia sp. 252]NEW68541.1 uracil phosphoribosyltransferase [Facklamia sp. 253]
MAKFTVVEHPLIQHKLTIIRDKNTSTKAFREVTNEIAMLMAYEITRDLPLEDVVIETPLVTTTQKQIAGKKLAIIPILRAGLGMVDGIVNLIPAARIGHIGLYRDHDTLEAVEYFAKFPQDISERRLFVVDPMLATGGSAIAALDLLTKKYNVSPENIVFVCLVAAPEGVKAIQEAHPDVDVYTAALDERLNDKGYILPGLGDAGDRIFGTK